MKKTSLPLLTTATLFAACGAPADEYRDALPKKADLTVEMPAQAGQSEAGLSRQALIGEPAEFYTSTYYESRKLNAFGAFVVELVEAITDYPATSVTNDTATWGPFSDELEPNEFRLTVTRHEDGAVHYTWALEGRPKSATDYTGLAGGDFEPAAVPDQGRGWFVVDFEAIRTLNPAEDGRGQIAYAFEKDGTGVNVQALAQTLDAQGNVAHVAYLFGQRSAGDGYIVFAFPGDIHDGDPSQAAPENLLIRTEWSASGAGRADLIATEGDLGEGTAYGAQCWDDTFLSTFELFTYDGVILGAAGDPDTCTLAEAMPEALPSAEDLDSPFEAGR